MIEEKRRGYFLVGVMVLVLFLLSTLFPLVFSNDNGTRYDFIVAIASLILIVFSICFQNKRQYMFALPSGILTVWEVHSIYNMAMTARSNPIILLVSISRLLLYCLFVILAVKKGGKSTGLVSSIIIFATISTVASIFAVEWAAVFTFLLNLALCTIALALYTNEGNTERDKKRIGKLSIIMAVLLIGAVGVKLFIFLNSSESPAANIIRGLFVIFIIAFILFRFFRRRR